MLSTIVADEGLLFDLAELTCFERYAKLSCAFLHLPLVLLARAHYRKDGARYLLIRLCLRKTDQWIKLGDLKYQRELGQAGILDAVRELCRNPLAEARAKAQADFKPKVEPKEVDIHDLTMDNDELRMAKDPSPAAQEEQARPDYTYFARDESQASLEELLDCLRLDDLKDLVRQMRLKTKDNKVRFPFFPSLRLFFSLLLLSVRALFTPFYTQPRHNRRFRLHLQTRAETM